MERPGKALLAAIVLQLMLLAAIPAPLAWTRWTGETVLLEMQPVDPFDPMRGWYQDLAFEVGDPSRYPEKSEDLREGRKAWVIVAPDEAGVARPVAVAATSRPVSSAAMPGRVTIRMPTKPAQPASTRLRVSRSRPDPSGRQVNKSN